jgi:purine nucleosidase
MLKLHIDTDLGGDIDDLCALAMALRWPDVELLAVTTVAEHQGKRAGYVRYALSLIGREDILVGAGADVSQHLYRTWQGLPKETDYWPEPIPPAPASIDLALLLLKQSIEEGAIIIAIGALTNLALLEKRYPGILRQAEIYLMGGYVFAPREGFPQWGHEIDFNMQIDAQSALYVIERSSPTFIPLAVSVETALRRTYLNKLKQSDSLARLIARQAEAFARDENFEVQYGQTCKGLPDDIVNFQHDSLACAIGLGWRDEVVIEEIPLISEIKEGWLHHMIDANGRPTRVVTRIDGDKFNEFWLRLVASQV